MNKALNLTILFLLAASFILKAPSIMDNMSMEGRDVLPNKLYKYNLNGEMGPAIFPIPGKNVVAIFWASWCLPCKIELSRINDAIIKGDLNKESIYAISLDQNFNELDEVIKEKNYQFNIFIDKELNFINKLKVTATPTLIFINKYGKIREQSTGASLDPVAKITKFIKNN
jgi:thiol-disulfide isomerase/thioredoxin